MNDLIKTAAEAAGREIQDHHTKAITKDRDRWKLQARIARGIAAAACVLLIYAFLVR